MTTARRCKPWRSIQWRGRSRLLQLLSAKQGLIARLQEIDGELAPSRDDDPAARAWPSPAEHARCQKEAARCETLLAGILELEQVAEREMIRRRDEVAKRLAEFESASAAQSAYAHAARYVKDGVETCAQCHTKGAMGVPAAHGLADPSATP